MINSKTGVLMSANNNVIEFEKVMIVGGTILFIVVLGFKVLRKMVRIFVEKVENIIDFFNRDEIEAEKERTAELLKKYEMETEEIDESQEKIYTRII